MLSGLTKMTAQKQGAWIHVGIVFSVFTECVNVASLFPLILRWRNKTKAAAQQYMLLSWFSCAITLDYSQQHWDAILKEYFSLLFY